ncbi:MULTISPECIES: cupredoxin domain-containing protein [Pseudoalteromonas]|nr:MULTISPECIES: cupredoxin domain-containing protein [Pseudoalteromonas]MCG7561153.1 cupredoxin domain-containing protein [Pseudoalteromonas sp. McH1-42]MEC4088234.1 cupredoxin domain-containing protein [Pseudoalteromonas rubra]
MVCAPTFALETRSIVLKNHLFSPQSIVVPARKKIRLVIENQDPAAEEFDSFDLNREKVLFPGRKSVIYIGPLEPGEYSFFGEFAPNTARGIVIAKEDSNAP